MAPFTQTHGILVLASLGAIGQALLAFRYYEPMAKGDEEPIPALEAVFFGIAFALFFGILGVALATFATLAPPYTTYGVLVVTPVALYSAWSTHVGRLGSNRDRATRFMGVFAGVVGAAYPPLIVLL